VFILQQQILVMSLQSYFWRAVKCKTLKYKLLLVEVISYITSAVQQEKNNK